MRRFKKIFALLGFVLVFMLTLKFVNRLLFAKNNYATTFWTFYEEKPNTLDVIALGSSHSYRSLYPMELYRDHGITCYNMANPSQSFFSSYYLLKEALQYQKPKVVLLEAYAAIYPEYIRSYPRLHAASDYMRYGPVRLSYWLDYIQKDPDIDHRVETIFPLALYHTRFDQLTQADFEKACPYNKGALPVYRYKKQKKPGAYQLQELYPNSLAYFDKIRSLCSQEGIELVLYASPMSKFKSFETDAGRIASLIDYAKSCGLAAINMQDLIEEIGFDFKTDFYNDTHLNSLGGSKSTKYLGDFLSAHYDLPDHRGETGYESWEENLTLFQEEKLAWDAALRDVIAGKLDKSVLKSDEL